MKDPERLADGTGTGLSALLLGAGIEERPSDESMRSTLSLLGLAAVSIPTAVGTVVGASATTAAAKSGAGIGMGALFAKWLVVGAACGSVVVGSTLAVTPSRPPSTRLELPAPVEMSPRRLTSSIPANEPSATKVAEPSAPPVPRAVEPVPAPAPPVVLEVPLAGEIALVDEARVLLAKQKFASVIERLGGYETDFPRLRLLPEVLYLRMEAAAGAKDAAQTSRVAQQLSAQFPHSPQVARAKERLAGAVDEKSDQEPLRAGTTKQERTR